MIAAQKFGMMDPVHTTKFNFDNQALISHRAMTAILGAILKLPPLKQILANKQIKSKYLGRLIDKLN